MRALERNVQTLSYMLIFDFSITAEFAYEVYFTDQTYLARCFKCFIAESNFVEIFILNKISLYSILSSRGLYFNNTRDTILIFRTFP